MIWFIIVTLYLNGYLVSSAVEEVSIEDYPYYVALQNPYFSFLPAFYSVICGGSIISENIILTTAYCVQNLNHKNGRIVAGTSKLSPFWQSGDDLYSPVSSLTYPNFEISPVGNIGMISTTNLIPSEKINKIEFLKLSFGFKEVHYEGVIVGHGNEKIKFYTIDTLKKENVFLSNVAKCVNETYNNEFYCVHKEDDSPSYENRYCIGISGGPIIISSNKNNKHYLAGIILEGEECWVVRLSIRTSFYQSWISEMIKIAENNNGILPAKDPHT